MSTERLELLTGEIRALIVKRANRPLSDYECIHLTDSFVVGNAFDIFKDAETINPRTVEQAKITRLTLTPE